MPASDCRKHPTYTICHKTVYSRLQRHGGLSKREARRERFHTSECSFLPSHRSVFPSWEANSTGDQVLRGSYKKDSCLSSINLTSGQRFHIPFLSSSYLLGFTHRSTSVSALGYITIRGKQYGFQHGFGFHGPPSIQFSSDATSYEYPQLSWSQTGR